MQVPMAYLKGFGKPTLERSAKVDPAFRSRTPNGPLRFAQASSITRRPARLGWHAFESKKGGSFVVPPLLGYTMIDTIDRQPQERT